MGVHMICEHIYIYMYGFILICIGLHMVCRLVYTLICMDIHSICRWIEYIIFYTDLYGSVWICIDLQTAYILSYIYGIVWIYV